MSPVGRGNLKLQMSRPGEPGVLPLPTGDTRTIQVVLLPTPSQHKKLLHLADITARLWNELNYELRQLFFSGNFDWKKVKEIEKEYYHRYKTELKVNAGVVIQKLNEAWRSFFDLLKKYSRGQLPEWFGKPSPPGYWKDRELGKRKRIILVRNDRYYIEQTGEDEGFIVLKDWKLKIPFKGRLRWRGKQGRLEIIWDDAYKRWYAHIPVEVGKSPAKSNPKGLVPGDRDKIQQYEPKGRRKAFIDLGINNLVAGVIEDGTAFLVKGGPVKAEHFYWKKEASLWQKLRDIARNNNWGIWRKYHSIFLKVKALATKRIKHLQRTVASFLAKFLWKQGVSEVYIGYPKDITHQNGNEYNVAIWKFKEFIQRLAEKLAEYGIKLFLVNEAYTSKTCSLCGQVHENGRVHRGLYCCPVHKKCVNADVNASVNIAKKVKGLVIKVKKILSFIPSHNGVFAITPYRGVTP